MKEILEAPLLSVKDKSSNGEVDDLSFLIRASKNEIKCDESLFK